MKNILKIEEAGMLMLASFVYSQLHLQWWIFFAFFLAPDIGMFGYLISAKIGATTYNLFHHKGIAVAFGIVGTMMNNIPLEVTGIILFAHSSFDRMLGYGLKYPDDFKKTHLGMIGQGRNQA